MADTGHDVCIAGGGWAGLAAAVELARHDVRVQLLESARQLGGRARRIAFGTTGVDNGQHILIGAYESTLDLLRLLDVPEHNVVLRRPLDLTLLQRQGRRRRITAGHLPSPLHLAWGLTTARGFTVGERIGALRFCARMLHRRFSLDNDCSVKQLLEQHQQPASLITALWEPLCLATLNTHIDTASATVFLRVLRDSFTGGRRNSDLLFTLDDLSAMIPDPAADFIERHDGAITLGARVTGLAIADGQTRGLTLEQQQTIVCRQIILATPAHTTQRLIAPHPPLAELGGHLENLAPSPICTLYFRYAPHVTLGQEMVGLVGTLAQWAFDRRICKQPGLIAVVISGSGRHMDMTNDHLAHHVADELAALFPDWPRPLQHLVVREKRATFQCSVDSAAWRPGNETPVKGLWLAGDYTQTGLPATLEGAVQSGIQCARAVIRQLEIDQRTAADESTS